MSDILAREYAIAGVLSSDAEVVKNLQEMEQYIVQNKSTIMKCLSSLPGPILGTVKGIVKIFLLTPLKYLLALPLTKISKALEDFTKAEPASPQPLENGSDCVPTQIV